MISGEPRMDSLHGDLMGNRDGGFGGARDGSHGGRRNGQHRRQPFRSHGGDRRKAPVRHPVRSGLVRHGTSFAQAVTPPKDNLNEISGISGMEDSKEGADDLTGDSIQVTKKKSS